MLRGVIGSTVGSGPASLGSSPGGAAEPFYKAFIP